MNLWGTAALCPSHPPYRSAPDDAGNRQLGRLRGNRRSKRPAAGGRTRPESQPLGEVRRTGTREDSIERLAVSLTPQRRLKPTETSRISRSASHRLPSAAQTAASAIRATENQYRTNHPATTTTNISCMETRSRPCIDRDAPNHRQQHGQSGRPPEQSIVAKTDTWVSLGWNSRMEVFV